MGALVTVDLSLDEVNKFAKRTRGDEESKKTKTARFLHSVLREFACNSGDVPQPQTRYGSITAKAVVAVPLDFDARYSSLWKRYVYYICAGDCPDQLPFVWSRYSWHIKQSLDFGAMVDAATLLAGEHNFEWMSVQQQGELRNPRRKLQLCVETMPMMKSNDATANNYVPYFLQQNEDTAIYKITCTCDFFLYKMVRRIVGILVAVGRNAVGLDALKTCLDEHDLLADDVRLNGERKEKKVKVPTKLLQTAPAKGLCLEHIEYEIAI